MKEHSIYTDVPGAPGVSILYDAHESRALDALLSGLIEALRADASWYSSVMIRARARVVRVVAIDRPGLHLAHSVIADVETNTPASRIPEIVDGVRREMRRRAGMAQ